MTVYIVFGQKSSVSPGQQIWVTCTRQQYTSLQAMWTARMLMVLSVIHVATAETFPMAGPPNGTAGA